MVISWNGNFHILFHLHEFVGVGKCYAVNDRDMTIGKNEVL